LVRAALSETILIKGFESVMACVGEDALIQFKRTHVPELTEESAQEPFIQFMRATALVGHLNNGIADMVANESTLPTAKLPQTVRNMLRLIGFNVPGDRPSKVDLLFEMAQVLASQIVAIPAFAQLATTPDPGQSSVFFEVLSEVPAGPTNVCTAVLAWDESAATFTDHTLAANDPTSGTDFTPWAAPAAGDALYVLQKDDLRDELDLALTTPGAGITGVWEVYDGNFKKTKPDSVTDNGATLTFDLTAYLGLTNRTGTRVRVQPNKSTAYEDVVVYYQGGRNKADTSLLGQSVASIDIADYTIGSDWEILNPVTDGTGNLSGSGVVSFKLPQSSTKNWIKTLIEGTTGYPLRFRIISVNAPTAPVVSIVRVDTGKQYIVAVGTQGRRQVDPVYSSTGAADQRVTLAKDHFIEESETISVDGVVWVRVENLLASRPTDRHYAIELGENDRATIVFGDGQNGAVPPPGVGNIEAEYRWGAHDDGNIGALTVTTDKTGLTYVAKTTNPRSGSGWRQSMVATAEGLERAKIEGPATLKVLKTALNGSDIEEMTAVFEDAAGARPFSRARVIEEGYGPKTFKNIVVGAGGNQMSLGVLAELDLWFNGNQYTSPPKRKRVVSNHQVTSTNYVPRAIDVTATVHGPVTQEQVENQLKRLLAPEALKDDGVAYEWDFGSEVPISRLSAEIFKIDPRITKVVMSLPVADVQLAIEELPAAGVLSITIVN